MKFTLEKRKKEFELSIDGRDVVVVVVKWSQGFKGSKSFEDGWYFKSDKDKVWFEELSDEDKKEFRQFMKKQEL